MPIYFSFIVPVFNRPQEVEELLESLTHQRGQKFEVIIVEDGSNIPCREVAARYSEELELHYFEKPNSGPGDSRNYGAERALGDYFIVLDSDVVLPPAYLEEVVRELERAPCDAFGGPDRADDSFTQTQKAINYAMTSFFTTGGIRGGKRKLDKFYPRSYNMGVRRETWERLNGFAAMRFGEDIDFSLRLIKSGAQVRLLSEAWVYHKRRVDLRKFYRQVYNFGIARIDLEKRHPGSMKLVHKLPALFTLGSMGLLLITPLLPVALLPLLLFAGVILIDASFQNRNIAVGVIAIVASFVQLYGYGMGFIEAYWRRIVCKGEGFTAFQRTFYK